MAAADVISTASLAAPSFGLVGTTEDPFGDLDVVLADTAPSHETVCDLNLRFDFSELEFVPKTPVNVRAPTAAVAIVGDDDDDCSVPEFFGTPLVTPPASPVRCSVTARPTPPATPPTTPQAATPPSVPVAAKRVRRALIYTPVHAQITAPPNLMPKRLDVFGEELRRELATTGYVIVPNVVPAERARVYADNFFEWLERKYGRQAVPRISNFNRWRRETWSIASTHYDTDDRALHFSHGLPYEPFAIACRAEEAVVELFATLWGVKKEKLIGDADGFHLTTPADNEKKSETLSWNPHMLQSPCVSVPAKTMPEDGFGAQCVHAYVQLANNQSGVATVQALAGSHLHYDKLMRTSPYCNTPAHAPDAVPGTQCAHTRGCAAAFAGYVMPGVSDLAELTNNGTLRAQHLCANPGDVILVDSRTVRWHTATDIGKNMGVSMSVCYMPKPDNWSVAARARHAGAIAKRQPIFGWPHFALSF